MSNTTRRRSIIGASLSQRDDSAHTLGGYAAVFDSWTDLYGSEDSGWVVRERILPGAFQNALVGNQDVRALVDHNPTLILGRTRSGTLRLREDSHGLAVEIDPPDTQLGVDTVKLVKRGDVSQMSFAFIPRSNGEKLTIRTQNKVEIWEYEISDVDLYDVSLVTYPAYDDTSIGLRTLAPEIVDRVKRAKGDWLTEARAKSQEIARRLGVS